MSTVIVKDWYQLDFKIRKPTVDLKKIDSVMKILKSEDLISKWFFLFEGLTIRVRMASLKKKELQVRLSELANSQGIEFTERLPFSKYAEGGEMLFNEEVVKRFANIMSEVTQLTIKKIKQETQFDTYRIMERIRPLYPSTRPLRVDLT